MLLMARGVVLSVLVKVVVCVTLVVPISCAAKVRLVTESFTLCAKLAAVKAITRTTLRIIPSPMGTQIFFSFINHLSSRALRPRLLRYCGHRARLLVSFCRATMRWSNSTLIHRRLIPKLQNHCSVCRKADAETQQTMHPAPPESR